MDFMDKIAAHRTANRHDSADSRVCLVGMDELVDRYRFERKFMALCRECGNYGTNWACPPFDFDAAEYLGRYCYAYLFALKWTHDTKTIAENDTVEKATAYSRTLFRNGKEKMLTLLYRLEAGCPGSAGMSAGGCSLCARCSRFDKRTCLHPEKVRHSPESLGFDLAGIAKDFLGIEMLWGNTGLPEYQVLVNALFTTETHDGIEQEIREYMNTNFSARRDNPGH